MSASIRIESGIAAGTNYWIDRPVLRIGSDPQCEICLPTADLAPHALTLEFRSGTYRAYNRGATAIFLGRTSLQPGAAGVWNDGDVLTLPGDQRLALAVDGDPRPCPRPESRMDDGFEDDKVATTGEPGAEVTPEAAKKAKSKAMMQLAVIGMCVFGMGGLLFMNSGGGSAETPAANRPSFSAIVASSQGKSEAIRTFVERLQYAQSMVVRGRKDRAKPLFATLRDQLMRQMDSLPPADQKEAKVIQTYVEGQLSQL